MPNSPEPFHEQPYFEIGEGEQSYQVLSSPVQSTPEGAIYHGRKDGEDFIIKEWAPDKSISREAFERGVQIMLNQASEVAATVNALLEHEGKLYLVMRAYGLFEQLELTIPGSGKKSTIEKFTGDSLENRIKQKDMALPEAVDISKQLFYVVDKLHSQDLYHFDLKPDNLLFWNGVWKLIDFSLCQQGKTSIVSDDTPGTPSYMSPERCFPGEEIDNYASELYSVGLIIFRVLTEEDLIKTPAPGESPVKAMMQLANFDPNKPSPLTQRMQNLINASKLVPDDMKQMLMDAFIKLFQYEPSNRNPQPLKDVLARLETINPS